MTQTFSNWTEYDNWLVKNYEQYAITSVNEENSTVTAEFIEKAEWEALVRKEESESETAPANATEPAPANAESKNN